MAAVLAMAVAVRHENALVAPATGLVERNKTLLCEAETCNRSAEAALLEDVIITYLTKDASKLPQLRNSEEHYSFRLFLQHAVDLTLDLLVASYRRRMSSGSRRWASRRRTLSAPHFPYIGDDK